MSVESNVAWARNHIDPSEIARKHILEVGSKQWPYPPDPTRDEPVLTDWLQSLGPASFTGVDIIAGKGVTHVVDVCDLVKEFGMWRFDAVISLAMLEHVEHWQIALENMKAVCKPGGILILTTNIPGYPRHDYPHDYWRFTGVELTRAMAAFNVEAVEVCREVGEVYLRARKTAYKAVAV